MSLRILLIDWCIVSLFWAVTPSSPKNTIRATPAADLNKQFQDPNSTSRSLSNGSRRSPATSSPSVSRSSRRSACDRGMAVADIGAGTGLFTWIFAEKVGTKGTVYAVEIAPAFLKYLEEESRKRGLEKL